MSCWMSSSRVQTTLTGPSTASWDLEKDDVQADPDVEPEKAGTVVNPPGRTVGDLLANHGVTDVRGRQPHSSSLDGV
jgi:hypothetical protein